MSDDYNDYHDHNTYRLDGRRGQSQVHEVIERAANDGPQTVTRNGRTTAVIVAAAEWERKTKRTGSLAEFFAGSPLRGSRLKLPRRTDRPRKVDL